jgi:hypothetical protein
MGAFQGQRGHINSSAASKGAVFKNGNVGEIVLEPLKGRFSRIER